MKPMPTKIALLRIFIVLFLCLTAMSTWAATSKGIEYQDQVNVYGTPLSLNGIGLLKWKYLVKVYLVGLYKPGQEPVSRILEDIPKRLEFYFFVEMKASDFQDTGFELMAQNIGQEKARTFAKELAAFNELYRDVAAGSRYTISHLPGKGLEMALNDQVLGIVEGDDFANAYLSIWLGPNPVSASLQEEMFDPASKDQ
jgi:hypothetical protein